MPTYYLTDDLDYNSYVTLDKNDVIDCAVKDANLILDDNFTDLNTDTIRAMKTVIQSPALDFDTVIFPICRQLCDLAGDYLTDTKPSDLTERDC